MKKKIFGSQCKKGRKLAALLAMCLTITSLGLQVTYAENTVAVAETGITKATLIPDKITINSAQKLSAIALPQSQYGTLSWVYPDYTPTKYQEACTVIFKAVKDADYSKVAGWDAKTRTVTTTVIVENTSLAGTAVPSQTPVPTQIPAEGTPVPTAVPTQTPLPSPTQGIQETPVPTEVPQVTATPVPTEAPQATVTPDVTVTPNPSEIPNVTETPTIHPTQEPTEVPSRTPQATPTVTIPVADTPNPSETPDPGEDKEGINDIPMESLEDNSQRPKEVEESMSLEEQARIAAENHTCQGITVSGDFLPWYVQFQVSNGDSYQFTNETDANIFQAYEFRLWDLLNNREYEIPEGYSLCVTVPVKEGYEYSIEHILDDGTIEKITPDVYGSTMVFSTSSFSPFGIAGSKPIVGGDIAEDGYSGTTPSPTVKAGGSSSGSNLAGSQSSGSISQSGSKNTGSANSGSTGTAVKNTTGKAGSNTTSKGAVQTGDQTQILSYVLLLIAASIAGWLIFTAKRARR